MQKIASNKKEDFKPNLLIFWAILFHKYMLMVFILENTVFFSDLYLKSGVNVGRFKIMFWEMEGRF